MQPPSSEAKPHVVPLPEDVSWLLSSREASLAESADLPLEMPLLSSRVHEGIGNQSAVRDGVIDFLPLEATIDSSTRSSASRSAVNEDVIVGGVSSWTDTAGRVDSALQLVALAGLAGAAFGVAGLLRRAFGGAQGNQNAPNVVNSSPTNSTSSANGMSEVAAAVHLVASPSSPKAAAAAVPPPASGGGGGGASPSTPSESFSAASSAPPASSAAAGASSSASPARAPRSRRVKFLLPPDHQERPGQKTNPPAAATAAAVDDAAVAVVAAAPSSSPLPSPASILAAGSGGNRAIELIDTKEAAEAEGVKALSERYTNRLAGLLGLGMLDKAGGEIHSLDDVFASKDLKGLKEQLTEDVTDDFAALNKAAAQRALKTLQDTVAESEHAVSKNKNQLSKITTRIAQLNKFLGISDESSGSSSSSAIASPSTPPLRKPVAGGRAGRQGKNRNGTHQGGTTTTSTALKMTTAAVAATARKSPAVSSHRLSQNPWGSALQSNQVSSLREIRGEEDFQAAWKKYKEDHGDYSSVDNKDRWYELSADNNRGTSSSSASSSSRPLSTLNVGALPYTPVSHAASPLPPPSTAVVLASSMHLMVTSPAALLASIPSTPSTASSAASSSSTPLSTPGSIIRHASPTSPSSLPAPRKLFEDSSITQFMDDSLRVEQKSRLEEIWSLISPDRHTKIIEGLEDEKKDRMERKQDVGISDLLWGLARNHNFSFSEYLGDVLLLRLAEREDQDLETIKNITTLRNQWFDTAITEDQIQDFLTNLNKNNLEVYEELKNFIENKKWVTAGGTLNFEESFLPAKARKGCSFNLWAFNQNLLARF